MNAIKRGIIFLILLPSGVFAQKRDSVLIKRTIFEVMYSETKEQPLWLKYEARPIVKVADRKGIDFYTEKEYHTSDGNDYANNVYDKGHIAPAAHFTDTKENLVATFSYLNCALQNERLNRGEWRLLEEQERNWAESEILKVYVKLTFSKDSPRLPTGAVVPDGFYKEVTFTKQNSKVCFFFPNIPPTKKWQEYKIDCKN